jgi:uncharacterized RDD family membrane protein YckC
VSSDAAPLGLASPATNGVAPRAPEPPPPPGSPYSGLATRVLACAIDVLIVQAVAWTVGAVAAVAASMLDLSEDLETLMIAAGAVVAALWTAGYFVFFWSTTGQTPGDRVMEIRVQDADGRPLHFARAVVRLLGALLSALLLFLGYLMILVDDRRRALHDRMVGSVVVYVPSARRRRRGPVR